MPRLTRTQKFAELRDSLANDKESSLQTKDLSNYEDRLNSITELLSPQNKTEEPAPVFEMPKEEPVVTAQEIKEESDPKYTWTDFEETPVEALVESFKNSDLEKQIQEFAIENQPAEQETVTAAPAEPQVEEVSIASTAEVKPLIDTPVYEAPAYEQPVIEEVKEDVKPLIDESVYQVTYAEDQNTIEEPPVQEPATAQPLIQDEVPSFETPVEEEKKESEETVYPGYYRPSPEIEALYKEAEEKAEQEELAAETEEVSPVIEDAVVEVPVEEPVKEAETAELAEEVPSPAMSVEAEPVEETESIKVVEEPVKEEVKETAELPRLPIDDFVDNHMADHEAETNTYLSDMMAEVDQYNTLTGDLTISQLTSNMVNEIRHPEAEEVKAQMPVEETPVEEADDEEFSNTVSMEIAKIMDEIDAIEEEPVKVPEEVVTPAPAPAPVYQEPVKEEHPVLAKALEEESEEEVVEIKNLKELEAEPTKDTVSNTIPFVVTTDDDEEEIEDDEEDGSNTILNIILIVLIIVLVAVLGLIVFYILKTKGVI